MPRRSSPVSTQQVGVQVLASKAAAGDRQAFDQLFFHLATPGWGLAFSLTPNIDTAAEIVLDAVVRMLHAVRNESATNDELIGQFLRTIAVSGEAARTAGLHEVVSTGENSGRHARRPNSVLGAPLDTLAVETFAEIDPQVRAILWLSVVEGYTPQRIAEILELSPVDVEDLADSTVARARKGYASRRAAMLGSDKPVCRDFLESFEAFRSERLPAGRMVELVRHSDDCAGCGSMRAALGDFKLFVCSAVPELPEWIEEQAIEAWTSHISGPGKVEPREPGFWWAQDRRRSVFAAAAIAFVFAAGLNVIVTAQGSADAREEAAAARAAAKKAAATTVPKNKTSSTTSSTTTSTTAPVDTSTTSTPNTTATTATVAQPRPQVTQPAPTTTAAPPPPPPSTTTTTERQYRLIDITPSTTSSTTTSTTKPPAKK